MPMTRRTIATCGVLGGNFLAAIEATIVAAAMPTVVGQLGGLAHYSWVFSAYLLASTVTLPLWGKLSDLYGRRLFYLGSVGFFLLGSVLRGTAHSMPALIVYRAIQGIGAGGLLPLGLTIIGELYTIRERGRMQGLFSGVWGVASLAGPLVGGYLTDTFSWRWVFLLNLPFGVVAASAVWVALAEPRRHLRPYIDYRGALFLSATVIALLLALSQSGGAATLDGRVLAALYVGAALCAAAFVRVEGRVPEPLVPFDLFAERIVGAAMLCGLLIGTAMFGAIAFVPLFVQVALGGTATQAGTALTPLILGWVTMSVVTGRVLLKVGYRPMLLLGPACVSLGFIGLTQIGVESSFWTLRATLAAMGIGMGMTMLTLILAVQNAVAPARLGIATSLGQFTRSIGGAVGVAVMGLLIVAAVPEGQEAEPAAMEQALHRVFLLGACVAAAAVGAAFRVPAGLPVDGRAERVPEAAPLPGR